MSRIIVKTVVTFIRTFKWLFAIITNDTAIHSVTAISVQCTAVSAQVCIPQWTNSSSLDGF